MNCSPGRLSLYDVGMFPLEWLSFRQLRRRVIPYLDGHILEIGAGTGANLGFYRSSAQVAALEKDWGHLHIAAKRRAQASVTILQGDAARLPVRSASCDHVVGTFVMCSLLDPAGTLTEIQRVLVPGGWLTLVEHVRGKAGLGQILTDWLTAPWLRLSGSCHLNRATADIVAGSGLRLVAAPRQALGLVQIIVARKG